MPDVRTGAGATPWPILAAAGLATGEFGILVGSVPVAAAGLVLLGGGVSGIVAEARSVGTPSRSMVAVGGLFLLAGSGVWAVRSAALTASALSRAPAADGIAKRGLAVVVAGCFLLALGAAVGWRRSLDR